jgi:hypothetical protein
VLTAIREAMQSMSSSRRSESADDVAGRIIPEITPARYVSRWWRAGAIGAIAASIVFGFTALQMFADNKGLQNAQEANKLSEMFFHDYGARFEKTFLSPDTRFVQFSPASNGTAAHGAKATLLFDTTSRKAQLFLKNFSGAVGKYSLVVIDDQGHQTRAVLEFQSAGSGVDRRDIDNFDLEGAGHLEIIQGAAGNDEAPAVLKSNKL